MRLIDNLLESVRIEAGQLSIRQQSVDMAEVVADAHDLISPLLLQRQLRVEVDAQGVAAFVRGDAQRLGQVLVNLLANAAKFSPERSTIRVGGQRLGNQIEIWVEDEGQGLPVASPDAIFERFRRGADSEPDAPGLGLGLWIVKSIMERHGGSIRVERTAAQRTRFTLVLPQETEN
jgi:signal transduction histidine kinase